MKKPYILIAFVAVGIFIVIAGGWSLSREFLKDTDREVENTSEALQAEERGVQEGVESVPREQQMSVSQRCIFPPEIGGLKGGSKPDKSYLLAADDPEGVVALFDATYSNLKDIVRTDPSLLEDENSAYLFTLAKVQMSKFRDIQTAQALYSTDPSKMKDAYACTVAGAGGFCAFNSSSLSFGGSSDEEPYTMIWLEGDTIKSVRAVIYQRQHETIADADRRARDLVSLFVSAFKDCKI